MKTKFDPFLLPVFPAGNHAMLIGTPLRFSRVQFQVCI